MQFVEEKEIETGRSAAMQKNGIQSIKRARGYRTGRSWSLFSLEREIS